MNFAIRDNRLNQYQLWENNLPGSQHWGTIMWYDDAAGGFPPEHPHVAPWLYPGDGVMMADGWIVAGFDALNQPELMRTPDFQGTDNWLFFGYDPLGRCVKRWISSDGDPTHPTPTATYFYYDGSNLIQETGMTARTYVHGARVDEIVASAPGTGGWLYHYYDARGHCIMLTDASGGLQEVYEYDAFGQPYVYTGNGNLVARKFGSPAGNRFLFTGREWLKEVRVYDFRARMYQPELGRFLQPDPKQFDAGDYNLYRYCHNDPINHSDPTGLYVSGLTSWGGGDWIRGVNGITNRETDLINQAKLTDFLNSVKPAAREAATASHSTNVEHGGALANTKKHPNDLARGPMTASTEDVARNPQGTHGVMNQTDFEKKPLPPGHERVIGGYWGLARWQSGFPYGDKHALWTKHWSAVLGVPRPEGQHGQPDVHVFQYRPGMPEPRMDEP
jgi:RHS repeat-associated protein